MALPYPMRWIIANRYNPSDNAIAASDINDDGRTDVLLSMYQSSRVTALLGRSDGTFVRADYSAANGVTEAGVADFNGDGAADMIVSAADASTLTLLMQNRPTVPQLVRGDYTAGAGPQTLAVGDLDGDGYADVVTANNYGASLSILLNNRHGWFGTATTINLGGGPHTVKLADLNADGKLDLISSADNQHAVKVLLGIGDGTFEVAATYDVAIDPADFAVADYNGDGVADIAVADTPVGQDASLGILFGNGDGSFQTEVRLAEGGTYPNGIVTSDFNHDGAADLATVNSAGGDGNITVLLNHGDGTFAPAVRYAAGWQAQRIAMGDLNGDGHADLIATGVATYVYLGNADGSFRAGTAYATPAPIPGSFDAVVADVNGDGLMDVAVGGNGSSAAYLLLGDGTGALFGPTTYLTGAFASGIGAADFDHDGLTDLVTSNLGSDNITVLLHKSPMLVAQPANGLMQTTYGGAFALNVGTDGSVSGGTYLPNGGSDVAYNGAVGNVNGDAYDDVLVLSDWGGARLYYGQAGGNFVDAGVNFASAFQTRGMIADFNGDGLGDVIVNNTLGSLNLYMNTGSGFTNSFSLFEPGPDGYGTIAPLAAADFNGDGLNDLYVLHDHPDRHTDQILFSDGEGGFVDSSIALPLHAIGGSSPAFGDINDDGMIDIVTGLTDGGISALLNNGDGTFTAAGEPWPQVGTSILLGDIDGSGTLDAVLKLPASSGSLQWWSNDGSGLFSLGATIDADIFPRGIADFNGDGLADLYGVRSDSTMMVYLNEGRGQFLAAGEFNNGYATFGLMGYEFAL